MSFGDSTLVLGDQDPLANELNNAADCPACLIVVRGSQQGHRYALTRALMSLGREGDSDIVIDDPRVSRRQAQIVLDGATVKLIDGGSTNGTRINDEKIGPGQTVVLNKEDMIRVGGTLLKFLPQGELETYVIGMLESRAHTDGLTRLYNKGYLLEAMSAEFKRAKGLGTPLSLLVFDLDFFKKVNDTHGHDAGDQVLIAVAQLLKTAIESAQGILGRFGGEEFVALLPRMALTESKALAEAVRAKLAAHTIDYGTLKLTITASIGVATMTNDMHEYKPLFKQADEAVYAAKSGGRNRVCVFGELHQEPA